jgi:NAD(P)-dependent dehydrogenase (short-subunit alcohol dehydrogenase family)
VDLNDRESTERFAAHAIADMGGVDIFVGNLVSQSGGGAAVRMNPARS